MSLTERLRDALLQHEAGVHRLSNSAVRRVVSVLNAAGDELVRAIRDRLGWIASRGFDASDFTLRRLEANLAVVRDLIQETYRRAGAELRSNVEAAGKHEAKFLRNLFDSALPDPLKPAPGKLQIEPSVVRGIMLARPFQGGLLRDWMAKLSTDAARRVRTSVRDGLLVGDSVDQIVRKLVGTRANRYTDAVIEVSRKEAATIVRSALAHTVNGVRDAFYARNLDLVKGVQWVGTLDSHTCPQCGIRDGLVYSLPDHKPIGHAVPWGAGPGRLHPNDRCASVPVLKSFRDMGFDRDDLPAGTRASVNGQVPEKVKFVEWLPGQGPKAIARVLGTRRAELVQKGELEIPKMFDTEGELLSLEQLGIRDEEVAARIEARAEPAPEPAPEPLRDLGTDLDRALALVKRRDGPRLPPAVVRDVRDLEGIEERIRGAMQEIAATFSADGRALAIVPGTADRVSIPKEITDRLRGGTLTHNHPRGSSFSNEDLGFSIRFGLGEMRATGTNALGESHVFTLKPGPGGWPTIDEVRKAVAQFEPGVRDKMMARIRRGEITIDFANSHHHHELWTLVARALGLRYMRTRIR